MGHLQARRRMWRGGRVVKENGRHERRRAGEEVMTRKRQMKSSSCVLTAEVVVRCTQIISCGVEWHAGEEERSTARSTLPLLSSQLKSPELSGSICPSNNSVWTRAVAERRSWIRVELLREKFSNKQQSTYPEARRRSAINFQKIMSIFTVGFLICTCTANINRDLLYLDLHGKY